MKAKNNLSQKALRLEERKLFAGSDSIRNVIEDLEFEYYTRDSENHYSIVGFSGSRGKPDFNYYFKTPDKRNTFLAERIENLRRVKEYKDKRKAESKQNHYLTPAALCAKAIRNELKQKYPSIKFSVTCQNFSGGDSVDIHWIDGPLTKDVDALTSKYQYGHFDGMNDIYEYSNSRSDIPQAKYISCQRSMSDETRALITQRLEADYGISLENEPLVFEKFHCWPSDLIWRSFNQVL